MFFECFEVPFFSVQHREQYGAVLLIGADGAAVNGETEAFLTGLATIGLSGSRCQCFLDHDGDAGLDGRC